MRQNAQAGEEVLEACFADLLKGLVFDDEVMDWIVDALHQSHADEKKFRREAIYQVDSVICFVRPVNEQSSTMIVLTDLSSRISFERKSREWRQTQKRLANQIAEYENAAQDYVQDGVRLLELAKKAYFLFKQQNSSEKRKLLNFVCSNSTWNKTLTATFRHPSSCTYQHHLAKKKAAGNSSSNLRHIVAGHTGQSSQLFPVALGRNAQFLPGVARYLTMGKQLIVLGVMNRTRFSLFARAAILTCCRLGNFLTGLHC